MSDLIERLEAYSPPDRTICTCGADGQLGTHSPSCEVTTSLILREAAARVRELEAERDALRRFVANAFLAHPNLDMDIDAALKEPRT